MLNSKETKIVQKRMIDKDLKGVDVAEKFKTTRQNVNNVIHGRASSQRIEKYLKGL